MRIFLSYASEDVGVAEEILLSLTSVGHDVFFDQTSLPPGGDYNTRIRKAIEKSDGIVFLISPHSVAQGSYTQTELNLAKKKWSHPKGRVLPIMVGNVDIKTIPAYLRAVTILEPSGNIPAEVVAILQGTWGKRKKRRTWVVVGAVLTLAFILTFSLTPIRSFILGERDECHWIPKSLKLSGDILIARFDDRSDAGEFEIAHRLKDNLERQLLANDMEDVTVKVFPNPLLTREQADCVVRHGDFKAVIWGWYDDHGIKLYLILAGREITGSDLAEVPWELGNEPNEEIDLLIREGLPENTSFLSFFVIGHLHYQDNNYQAGHNAFEAAMSSVPENVLLQNEALLHFFFARQNYDHLRASAHPQKEHIINAVCGYSRAIMHDTTFAAAYNNLGIILSDFDVFIEDGAILPAETLPCLIEAGFNVSGSEPIWDIENGRIVVEYSGEDFFNEAIRLQPDLAVFHYNALAHAWKRVTIPRIDSAEEVPYKVRLEEILRQDASIPGAYIMLGVIAFDENDQKKASRHFLKSLSLVTGPVSGRLRVNLGQTQLRAGEHEDAKVSFQAALSINADDGEAHLALAAQALKNGQLDSALAHLNAIPAPDSVWNTLTETAAILRSRVHLEKDNVASAIETLEQLISGDHQTLLSRWGILELEHYLLGLLYTFNGNTGSASQQWTYEYQSREYSSAEAYHENNTAVLAWRDLYQRCNSVDEEATVTQWGEAVDCLPLDLRARIDTVYAFVERWLPYRVYFRNNVYFGDLACPHVFTYDDAHQVWRWDNTILFKLVGQTNEAVQHRRLKQFNGRLLIKEIEPEISYIDQLYVLVVDETGEHDTLQTQVEALQHVDYQYVILHQGDEILLDFTDYESTNHPKQYWVVTRGYYDPIKPGYLSDGQ